MGMSAEHKKLYKQIDEILWNDWDPIGVNDDAPRDEYQSYTPAIFDLKIKGADRDAIAQRLCEFEIERMGLGGDIEHCREIAEKIVGLEVLNEKK